MEQKQRTQANEGICTSVVWLLVFYKEPSILVFLKYFKNQRTIGFGHLKNLDDPAVLLNEQAVLQMVVFDFSKEIEERDYISKLVLSLWSIRSILFFFADPSSVCLLCGYFLSVQIAWSLSSWLCNYSHVLVLHLM